MQHATHSITDVYRPLVQWVLDYGEHSSPRGLGTTEVLDFSLILDDPSQSLCAGVGRRLNTKIGAVEALQLMGGVIDPPALLRASGAFKQFMDGGSFHGGYGQRTRAQMPQVVKRLQQDPHTRRALVTIWDPLHDLFTDGVNDYPCTVALQFLVRNDALILMTHMRSNDLWRGFPYDVFVFTQLQQAMAACLELEVGPYHHHVSSLHIYDSDREAIDEMLGQDTEGTVMHTGTLFQYGTPWDTIADGARSILEGDPRHTDAMTKGMRQWYFERT